MTHDELRELLLLVAAGGLEGEEAATVRRHSAECTACGEEIKRWEELTSQLAQLPSPAVPAWLVQRTVQRVKQRQEAAAEQRFHYRMLAFLIVFSWATSLAAWSVVHLEVNIGLVSWLVLSMLVSWVTAGSAAVILSWHASAQGGNV